MSEKAAIIKNYIDRVGATDRFKDEDIKPILLGLYGEVGSVMSTVKKFHREKRAFLGYRESVIEEYGDTLWYLAALCRRSGVDLLGIAISWLKIEAELKQHNSHDLDAVLLTLGEDCASILSKAPNTPEIKEAVNRFVGTYLYSCDLAGVGIAEIIEFNLSKVESRFIELDLTRLPDFDSKFDDEEKIPRYFEISITQRRSGKTYLRWNGVFIGDPLTDNIDEEDGYRFHDVFHFANAAILHWSPTFRSLIRHKRKSDPRVDEAQDSGRAIVVEEGLSALIFSRAKQLNFFEGQDGVSFDLLKTISQFVEGYEVEECPLKLWERAILQGYSVFREVYRNEGGIIIGNRDARTISYKPFKDA